MPPTDQRHQEQERQHRQWIQWLNELNGQYLERDRAEEQLLQITDPAVLDLIKAELPNAAGRRWLVLLRMAERWGADAAPLAGYLAGALHTEQHKQRDAMVKLLRGMGQAAKDDIYRALQGDTAIQDFHRKLLVDLLAPLEGEDIDPLLCSMAEHDSTTVRLHAIDALGQRKSLSAIPLLIGWMAPVDLDSYAESPEIQRRIRRAAAQALGQMGEVAAPAIPLLQEWLQQPHLGDRRLAIEALGGIGTSEAIALVLPYLHLPTDLPQHDLKAHAKCQKSAAIALQKQANPDALDRIVALYLQDKMANYSWRALADTIVVMVTQGLGPVDGFAWLRTLLEGTPHERLWHLLCALVNAWPEDERDMVLDYIDAHIDHWDDELRLVTYEASNSIGHWRLWWPQPPEATTAPCWPLVRSLHIKLAPYGGQSTSFLKSLQLPQTQKLTRLTLTHFELHKERAERLSLATLPVLRHLVLEKPTTTLQDLDLHLFDAPWCKQLETWQINAFHSKWFSRHPEYRKVVASDGKEHKVALSCELLRQDPRVAHIGFSLEQMV